MQALLITVAAVCVVWGVVAAIMILAELRRRGVPINPLLVRLLLLRYVSDYARLTREETGRTGPLFYHYVVPFVIAFVLCVVLAFNAWR